MSLAADFKETPYWWEGRTALSSEAKSLPGRADVVVIGAGVTGVEAARVLSEGGRHVVVLDSGEPGFGASSRNAGMIGRNFKHSYSSLKAAQGTGVARGFFAEMQDAYDAVRELGLANPEAFDWRENGRVIGALSPTFLDRLRREYESRAREIGETIEILDRAEVQAEIGSPRYVGGIRLPFNGSVQPARYHEFLAQRAAAAGADIIGHTTVVAVSHDRDCFLVRTARGTISCRQVLVATNGYTSGALPSFRRRLLPIASYMVATECLSDDAMRATLPFIRTYHDNRRRSHFFSVSSDSTRILMGGRTASWQTDLRKLAASLQGDLVHIFPHLEGTRLTHAWQGKCAAPVDAFPRFGKQDGLFYALGYSFSGMAMGPHLARKVAHQMLGLDRDATSFFARPNFPRVPVPARTQLTMPLLIGYYGWADRPASLCRRM